jgi:hypothetical protein
MKQQQNEFFTTSLYEIERVLEEKKGVQDDLDNACLVQERLPPCYYWYWDVFSKTAAEELLEH